MDPFLAAERIPKLATRAMRGAIVAAALEPGLRLIDDALIRFERGVQHIAGGGVRPSLLFAERDRIVRELRAFTKSRLAARLFALRQRDVAAVGRSAAPFDALVRGRGGGLYGVVFRRLAGDGRRLETMRAIRNAARDGNNRNELRGVIVYDFASGGVRFLRCGARNVQLSAA